MPTEENNSKKRLNGRLDRSLHVKLFDHSGKTLNISTKGVYLEMTTDDTKLFSPGSVVPIQITAGTTTPDPNERTIKLTGKAAVIRNKILDVTNDGTKLAVAMKIDGTLDIVPHEA